ncbi:MAG: thioredoxin family protein [Phycisphaerales bacterium]
MNAALLRRHFEQGHTYADYLASDPGRAGAWRTQAGQVRISTAHALLLHGFTRTMRVLVVSGIWCGDCSAQGPMLAAIADANPERIDMRWVDRDAHLELAEQIRICGGMRVPTVIWMAEDFEFVHLMGDRTLTRYRAMAARKLGASCPLPGAPVPPEEIEATLADWVHEFERVHLLLRLSPRLRELHRD